MKITVELELSEQSWKRFLDTASESMPCGEPEQTCLNAISHIILNHPKIRNAVGIYGVDSHVSEQY